MHRSSIPAGRCGRRAMSVIEVLVAAALLLVISLGILAMLTRSMANNTRGWEATSASNMVRSQLDTHLGDPLTANSLQIPVGAAESELERFWGTGSAAFDNDPDEGWYDTEALAQGLVVMHETRTIRQYHVLKLLGDKQGFSEDGENIYRIEQTRIDSGELGGTDPGSVNLRRIEISLIGQREGGGLGAGQRLRAETYKAY